MRLDPDHPREAPSVTGASPRFRRAAGALAGTVAALLLCGPAAGAPERPPTASVPALSLRVDGSVPAPGAGDRRVAPPVVTGGQGPSVEIPYRVEPRDSSGQLVTPYDVPPEKPDPRDFEQVQTFDELSNPQYEIREEIWNTPEDFITQDGLTRLDGIGYVPYWARNAIRYGRLQLYPFLDSQLIWTTNAFDGATDERALEAVESAGVLGEVLGAGGKGKVKFGFRGDYHGYDRALPDTTTWVGGIGVEQRFGRLFTVDAGIESERVIVPTSRNLLSGNDNDLVERLSAYANGRWDRFLSDDLRLEAGATWAQVDERARLGNSGDHEDLSLRARLSLAIMRHESFAYAEYRYETRDAHGFASDLDAAHEVRVGVDDILPHGRVRRLVGDAWVGWRWERYTVPAADGAFGEGLDTKDSLFTGGASLTYKPGPYTSGYLAYSHTNTFSTVSNFNTEDYLYLGVTQNLTNRIVGRVAATWTRLDSQGMSSSDRVGVGAGLRWVLSDALDLTADYEFSHRYAGATLSSADTSRIAVGLTLGLR